jgi:glycopeptide antibiotics resistance protein
VLAATLTPSTLDSGFESSIDKFFSVVHRHGVPDWFGYSELEFSANVVMFIPLGFFLALLPPARLWWLALLVCPALSIGIELTQATLLSGRFATVGDVVANSLGALVGGLAAFGIRAAIHRRDAKVIALAIWRHEHTR